MRNSLKHRDCEPEQIGMRNQQLTANRWVHWSYRSVQHPVIRSTRQITASTLNNKCKTEQIHLVQSNALEVGKHKLFTNSEDRTCSGHWTKMLHCIQGDGAVGNRNGRNGTTAVVGFTYQRTSWRGNLAKITLVISIRQTVWNTSDWNAGTTSVLKLPTKLNDQEWPTMHVEYGWG